MPDGIAQEDLSTAHKIVSESVRPAPRNDVDVALAELRASTVSRDASVEDLVILYKVFGDLCVEYPADVVFFSLRYIARNQKFWPALSELKEELDYRSRKRRLLLGAIEEALR